MQLKKNQFFPEINIQIIKAFKYKGLKKKEHLNISFMFFLSTEKKQSRLTEEKKTL